MPLGHSVANYFMKEFELIPNAKNLMESTRSIGYSLPAAVADLVDNSIAAEAETVEIWTPTESERYLLILDDGVGMSEKKLLEAMRYGSSFVGDERSECDLGRFGLGLKMASLSQCRRLTVISKRPRGKLVGARWDLDHIAKSKCPWALQVLESGDFDTLPWKDRLLTQKSGTLVIWEELDLLLLGINQKGFTDALQQRIQGLKRHLELVFHRYLSSESDRPFSIVFNGGALTPADPFLKAKSTMPYPSDPYGKNVRITPYLLPHPKFLTSEEKEMAGDLQKDQGFYIYRNKRFVIWGTWFRLCRKLGLSKLARVQVDIPATAEYDKMWSLDVKKSTASIPEQLKDQLRRAVDKLADRSGQVWTKRARREQSKDAFWLRVKTEEGNIRYVINEDNAVVKDFIKKQPELRVFLQLLSARLPLDSLYTDLSNDQVVDSDVTAVAALAEKLRKAGIDVPDCL